MKRRNFLRWLAGVGASLSCISNAGEGKAAWEDVLIMNARQGMALSSNTFNDHCIFENFIVSDSNIFARAVAMSVAEKPGLVYNYNPLVIHGDVGTGKTFLVRAIINHVRAQHKLKVLYETADRFYFNSVRALSIKKECDLRRKCRELDVLVMETIQFLAFNPSQEKERAQEELLYIIDHLLYSGKQVIITADKEPGYIRELDERLKSCLSDGFSVKIGIPEHGLKFAAIKQLARREFIHIPDETASLMASRSVNIREAEGKVLRIKALGSLRGKEISKSPALDAWKDLL